MKFVYESILCILYTWTIILGILVYIDLKSINAQLKTVGLATKNPVLYSVFAGVLSITVWLTISHFNKFYL